MTDDFILSCVFEYLERITGEEEETLRLFTTRSDLKKLDSVDIIDIIETRTRYECLCQVQHDITSIISWARKFN